MSELEVREVDDWKPEEGRGAKADALAAELAEKRDAALRAVEAFADVNERVFGFLDKQEDHCYGASDNPADLASLDAVLSNHDPVLNIQGIVQNL